MNQEAYPDALPAHYRLHWYELERVLGQGGFGITYLAHDHNLDLQVAIKEYLPIDVAQRRSDASVRPRTQPLDERYRWGLARFIEEARTLARFDHPNIVRVQSVFEANDTAYMVMRFEQGENLATLLDRRGTLGEDELLRILLPVLDGLACVHEAGFIHRDIKPENIHIRSDGSPVLLDFGSARFALGRSQSMTVLVAPGYAPLEQYHGEADSQGPWTDVYGLAATAYRAIAGVPPADAVLRARGRLGSTADTLPPAVSVGQGRYRASLLASIDHGLQLAEADRPQSMVAWRRELVGDLVETRQATAPPVARRSAPLPTPPARTQLSPPPAPAVEATASTARPLALSFALGVGVIAVAGGGWLWWPRGSSPPTDTAVAGAVPTSSATAQQASSLAERAAAASAPAALPPPLPLPEPPTKAEPIKVKEPSLAAAPAPASRPEPKPQHKGAAPPPGATKAPMAEQVSLPLAVRAPAPAPEQIAIATPAAPPPTITAPAPPAVDPLAAANEALRRGDDAAAYRLARPLGDTGHAHALELLGRLAEEGRGTAPSAMQAYIWYSLAALRGQAGARAGAERVAKRLQPAEIAQADRLVQNWRAQ